MTDTELAKLLRTQTPQPPPAIDLTAMAARIQADNPPRRRRWLAPGIAAAAVIVVVAASLVVARLPGDESSPTADSGTPASGPRPSQAQLAWARTLADGWKSQTFVPLGADWDFQQVGTLTDPTGSDRPYMLALAARRITSRIDLSYTPPVPLPAPRWADGRPLPVSVLPLSATFDRLLAGGIRCANCPEGVVDGVRVKPLSVINATPSTMRVQTARGPAVIPAWRFTFAETSVQVLQAAVEPPMVATATAMASKATPGPPMIPVERVEVAADGRTLTASFPLAPCGQRYAGYAVESDHTVGIVVATSSPNDKTCMAPATLHSVTVHLDAPLKDRGVIETARGGAVPVTHAR
jgi:hypothetical protein